jgi:hypothetical protein
MARPALERRSCSSTARAIFFRIFLFIYSVPRAQVAERKAQGHEERVAPTLPPSVRRRSQMPSLVLKKVFVKIVFGHPAHPRVARGNRVFSKLNNARNASGVVCLMHHVENGND